MTQFTFDHLPCIDEENIQSAAAGKVSLSVVEEGLLQQDQSFFPFYAYLHGRTRDRLYYSLGVRKTADGFEAARGIGFSLPLERISSYERRKVHK